MTIGISTGEINETFLRGTIFCIEFFFSLEISQYTNINTCYCQDAKNKWMNIFPTYLSRDVRSARRQHNVAMISRQSSSSYCRPTTIRSVDSFGLDLYKNITSDRCVARDDKKTSSSDRFILKRWLYWCRGANDYDRMPTLTPAVGENDFLEGVCQNIWVEPRSKYYH